MSKLFSACSGFPATCPNSLSGLSLSLYHLHMTASTYQDLSSFENVCSQTNWILQREYFSCKFLTCMLGWSVFCHIFLNCMLGWSVHLWEDFWKLLRRPSFCTFEFFEFEHNKWSGLHCKVFWNGQEFLTVFAGFSWSHVKDCCTVAVGWRQNRT
jgi:hypothetical protein